MTTLDDPDRLELENGVRTMLHTLAAEAHVDPPVWDDLIQRPAPVLHLPTAGRQAADPAPRPRWHHRPRTSVAAAAVVALAVGGALVVDRGTGDRSAELPPAETITAVSPTDPDFEVEAAAAVWTSDLDDPVAAAAGYLAANGIPAGPPLPDGPSAPGAPPIPSPPPLPGPPSLPSPPPLPDAPSLPDGSSGPGGPSLPGAPSMPSAPAVLELVETDGATATVDWSAAADSGSSGGTIYLRASDGEAAVQGWTVVGAAASDVSLDGVRYDGKRLDFTVSRTAASDAPLAIGVWVDGRPVSLGGESIPQPGDALVSLGELVDIGPDAGAERELGLPVDSDGTVTLRLEQVVDGHVRSLTQMVVVLPEADSSAATDIAAAAGRYAGSAVPTEGPGDTGTVEADASAEGEAGMTVPGAGIPVPDGGDLPVPGDDGVPTLPPLLPDLPLPAPPTAPSTMPAPTGDVLP
jgi:hypothetical protein